MNEIEKIIQRLNKFADDRDWHKFHTPKNLAMALSVEVAELVELFQWKTQDESWGVDRKKLEVEVADVFIYLLMISQKFNINIIESVNKKITLNGMKYPISRGRYDNF